MSAPLVLGLVRIGDMDLALPAALIEEIVRGPLDLTPLPRAPRHVLGVFAFRGAPVPVLDVATLLRPEAFALGSPSKFAVVVRHPAGRFALQVDAVVGVARATASELADLDPAAPQAAGLFARLYTPSAGGRVAVIPELEALLAVEGLRSVLASEHDADPFETADDGPELTEVLFRAGSACLSLDARHVRLVERRASELGSVLTHPVLRGFQSLRGEELPVVDLAALIGWNAANTDAPHLLVVESGRRAVALEIGAPVAVERIRAEPLGSVPATGWARPELFAGARLSKEHGVVLVLDPAELLRAASLVDGDDLFDRQEAGAAGADLAQIRAAERFLVYRAGGGALATALTELAAVLRLSPEFVDLRAPGSAAVGLCSWQGQAVAVLDLGALMGGMVSADPVGRPVLVVLGTRGARGYLVESVDFLQSAAPVSLAREDERPRGHLPAFRMVIRARSGERDVAACVLDLAGLDDRVPEKV